MKTLLYRISRFAYFAEYIIANSLSVPHSMNQMLQRVVETARHVLEGHQKPKTYSVKKSIGNVNIQFDSSRIQRCMKD